VEFIETPTTGAGADDVHDAPPRPPARSRAR
jgi:hypothetical protein